MKQGIYCGDNLALLRHLTKSMVRMVYIDPPFNTGKRQVRTQIKTSSSDEGDRVGFAGKKYKTEVVGQTGYDDQFDDYIGFLGERVKAAKRCMTQDASFFLHVDYREVHYCKVMMDEIFGRDSFMNEIIWAYDYGGRSKSKWSAKHDNILWYAMNPDEYVFNYEQAQKVEHQTPQFVGDTTQEDLFGDNRFLGDVWWHTIVSPTGKEKVGYATQKPLGILERLIKVHTNEGDYVLDFFAGSGTTGAAAARHNRKYILIDKNPEAMIKMTERLVS